MSLLGLASASIPAYAVNASCAGTSFSFVNSYRYCDVAAGESIQYTIKGGNGGNGNLVSGSGGAGAKIVGTFTNTTGATVSLRFYVGANGTAGVSGTSGSNGQLSSIGVQGSGSDFVVAGGGQGGGSNGSTGSSGVGSSTLPSGAAFAPTSNVEAPTVVFTAVSSTGEAPADILQQLPTSATGTCIGIADSAVAYGTGLSGGWHGAWAQWANGGKGGNVCSRTLTYSVALERWTIAD